MHKAYLMCDYHTARPCQALTGLTQGDGGIASARRAVLSLRSSRPRSAAARASLGLGGAPRTRADVRLRSSMGFSIACTNQTASSGLNLCLEFLFPTGSWEAPALG